MWGPTSAQWENAKVLPSEWTSGHWSAVQSVSMLVPPSEWRSVPMSVTQSAQWTGTEREEPSEQWTAQSMEHATACWLVETTELQLAARPEPSWEREKATVSVMASVMAWVMAMGVVLGIWSAAQ